MRTYLPRETSARWLAFLLLLFVATACSGPSTPSSTSVSMGSRSTTPEGRKSTTPPGGQITPTSFSNGITLERNGVIYVVRPGGSGLRKLVAIPGCGPDGSLGHDPCEAYVLAAWSPDGKHLAFSLLKWWGGSGTRGHVYVVNADGTGMHALRACNCAQFAWSPNGARLALVDAGKGGDLLRLSHGWLDTYRVNGEVEHRTSIPIWFSSPSWAQDGASIYFSELHSSADWLYMVGADGSGLRRMGTMPVSQDGVVEWSPSHSGVIHDEYDQRRNVLNEYVDNPIGPSYADYGREHPRLIRRSGCIGPGQDAGVPCGGPIWSPDGTRILYTDTVGVWTVDAHGSHPTLVFRWPAGTEFGGGIFWSKDGRWIVLTTRSGGGVSQVVMHADGSGLTHVPAGGSLIAVGP